MKKMHTLLSVWNHASPALKARIYKLLLVLLLLNIGVWGITLVASPTYPLLFALVTLSYGLGLRHAVDADHIAAIDNTTRKLMHEGKKPVAVGFFFSLGHATVVMLLTVLVIISSAFVRIHLPAFREVGTLVGMFVSGIFLVLIGAINCIALIETARTWKQITLAKKVPHEQQHAKPGFLIKFFKPVFRSVKESWHMYPVGFLFGLGFDTASEIALLSVSGATASAGMPLLFVLLLPLAFTAGMALVDSLDGMVMLGAYGWAYITPVRKVYYNMTITFISVIVAFVVGGIELLQLVLTQLHTPGVFAKDIISIRVGDVGYLIVGIFLLCWFVSIAIYIVKKYDNISLD